MVCFVCRSRGCRADGCGLRQNASPAEKLAGREVRRYFYLRTGKLLPIVNRLPDGGEGGLIVVGAKNRPAVQALLCDAALKDAVDRLAAEQYALKTLRRDGRPVLLVGGGDDIGALYGAYRFAERLGVRFYLHGNVIPDRPIPPDLPALDETRKPLFDCRGIQPFHDFPEGPDWWNGDAYKAILGQLPKMGMNFFGLHAYPESSVGPEPVVWIGPAGEIAADGSVKASYPSRHFTASNVTGAWGYRGAKTSDYVFGAAELFDRDDFGAEYMRGALPWDKMSPTHCNAVFDRMGKLLDDAFVFARRLGIKTCIGTETPLTIPAAVKQRLRAGGKNPDDPAVVQEIYEGMFRRIAKTHPLDYYWLWTDEGWTWGEVKKPQIDAVMNDFRAFVAAAERVKPPFKLATCGWVLGPPQDPSLFDRSLPKNIPMSCINRTVGNTPVEPGFAKVQGRPKWAIPWMEDNPGLTMPQLRAGRMRRDAFDALRYGCTGLMGIHWRTRILAPNVSALAKAAWDQSGWREAAAEETKPARFLPVADFYADWAGAEFGPEAAEPIAAIFTRLDGHTPRPADWVTGPGSLRPNPRPWNEVQKDYAFVAELAGLRSRISAGQPGTIRLLAEPVPLPPRSPRRLATGPASTPRSIAQEWEGSSGAAAACQGIGLAGAEGPCRRFCRPAPPFAFRRLQFRRTGQRLQLAATNARGGADRSQAGIGQSFGRRPARRRAAISKILGPAAVVRARGPHQLGGRRAASPDGRRAGRKPGARRLAVAPAGRRRVCLRAAGARGPRRLRGHFARRSSGRRFRVLHRSDSRRPVARVSADGPGAEPDGRCVRAIGRGLSRVSSDETGTVPLGARVIVPASRRR